MSIMKNNMSTGNSGKDGISWRNVAAMLISEHQWRNENEGDHYSYCNKRYMNNPDVKWYKTLPPGEMLPRNEVLGGYIFVCNNETMQEDLHRQLFGLPQKYKDSVRAIIPGLPLFLYNYTSHQLHGVFQVS